MFRNDTGLVSASSAREGQPSGGQTSSANGTKFGRPRKVANAEHVSIARRMKAGGHTAKDIAKYLGVSRAPLYRYLATV